MLCLPRQSDFKMKPSSQKTDYLEINYSHTKHCWTIGDYLTCSFTLLLGIDTSFALQLQCDLSFPMTKPATA